MKKILSALSIIAATLSLCSSSCEKEPKPQPTPAGNVSVSPESIAATSEKCVKEIVVSADCDWGISSSDKSWCTVSPSGGGKGDTKVKVSLGENSSNAVRTTELTIRFGSQSLKVSVRQNYKIEGVSVADPAFMKALLDGHDTDKDGILSTVEASAIKNINAASYGISSMDELCELFPALESLDCSNNKLTSLNISTLYQLTTLNCTGNPDLKSIYVWSGFKAPAGFSKPSQAEYIEPEINTPNGYKLVWQDEFAGNKVDSSKWTFEDWAPGHVNNELQRYVSGGVLDGQRTAFVENGVLNIRAMQHNGQVISARMNSTGKWLYGYMEARIQLPVGKGTWPAFWMMPNDFSKGWPRCGEIDIMEEVGANANYTSSSIHCMSYYHKIGTQKTAEVYTRGAESEFHVYACEWTEDYIKSYRDGELFFTFANDKTGKEETWPFNKTFYIILNLAWGGDWGGYKGVDNSALPCTMMVDYVRVFQKVK